METEKETGDEVYAGLSLETLCSSTHWKARIYGYREAIEIFNKIDDEKSVDWSKYLGLICNMVTDSNSAAQEKGLEAASIFMSKSTLSAKIAVGVTGGIINKCFGTTKQKVKELAVHLALILVENDKTDTVMEEVVKGLDNKNPKIVSTTISTLRTALHDYGNKCVNIKLIEGKLQQLLLNRDKTIRSESKQLTIEVFRWIGDAIKPHITNITSILQRELEDEFQKLRVETITPISTDIPTNEPKKLKKKSNTDAINKASIKTEVCEIETSITQAPENLLAILPKAFYKHVADKKWSVRKNGLKDLENLLIKHPVLRQEENYTELIIILKRIISSEINVLVLSAAIKCLRLLIKALGKQFNNYAAGCLPIVLTRLKERKQIVLNELRATLDAMYPIVNLEILYNHISESFTCKNPYIAYEALMFFLRCLDRNTTHLLNPKISKAIASTMVKIVDGSDLEAREAALKVMAHVMLHTDEHFISPFLVNMSQKRVSKIKDYSKELNKKFENTKIFNSRSLESSRKPASSTENIDNGYTSENGYEEKEPVINTEDHTTIKKCEETEGVNKDTKNIISDKKKTNKYKGERCEYQDSISKDLPKSVVKQKKFVRNNKNEKITQSDGKTLNKEDNDENFDGIFVQVSSELFPTPKPSNATHYKNNNAKQIKKYKKLYKKVNIKTEVEVEFFENDNSTTKESETDETDETDGTGDDLYNQLSAIKNAMDLSITDGTLNNICTNFSNELENNISDDVIIDEHNSFRTQTTSIDFNKNNKRTFPLQHKISNKISTDVKDTLSNEFNDNMIDFNDWCALDDDNLNFTTKTKSRHQSHECNIPKQLPDKMSTEYTMSGTYHNQDTIAHKGLPTVSSNNSCSNERLAGGARVVYESRISKNNAIYDNSIEDQLQSAEIEHEEKLKKNVGANYQYQNTSSPKNLPSKSTIEVYSTDMQHLNEDANVVYEFRVPKNNAIYDNTFEERLQSMEIEQNKKIQSYVSRIFQNQSNYKQTDHSTDLAIKLYSVEMERLARDTNIVYDSRIPRLSAIYTNSYKEKLNTTRNQQNVEWVISSKILRGLCSIYPAKRVIAIHDLQECINELVVKIPKLTQLIIRTINENGPGLKDPDGEVMRYKLKFLHRVVLKLRPSSQAIMPLVKNIVNNLTDENNKSLIYRLLNDFSDCGNHEQIVIEVLENVVSAENVTFQMRALTWVQNSILEFGFELTRYKFIQLVHSLMLSHNKTVHNAAIKLLGITSLYFNKDVILYCLALEQLTLLRKIAFEFDKMIDIIPPKPIRGKRN